MGLRNQEHWTGCLLVLVMVGCASSPPPPGVVRIDPRHPPKSLEGPIGLEFGPFDSYREALIAACPLILSQRRARAGHQGTMGFDARWRASTEYCSWLYYTPDEKYEMSMLVEGPGAALPNDRYEKVCSAPAFVEDKRYPKKSLKYIYFLHSHPESPTNLSKRDLLAVAQIKKIHGEFVETKEGRIPVGIVAFFANSHDPRQAECDGFIEYNFGSAEVVRWTLDGRGGWRKERAGVVTWTGETEFEYRVAQ
jgi:proteasome lid subunit RPN8/RPN11